MTGKAWMDLSTVPKPPFIDELPVDERGYPIPKFATIKEDGTPDFRVVNPQAWLECLRERQCQICGRKMDTLVAFVGGPLSMQSRTFSDAPMHWRCAEYALMVCPFLAAPKFDYGNLPVPDGHHPARPEVFGLGVGREYTSVRHGRSFAIHVDRWVRPVRWFQFGKELKDA